MRAAAHERMYRVEDEHFWFVGTRRVIVDVLMRALGERCAGARLLDLGCGTGYTLTQLPTDLHKVGLDRSAYALSLSATRAQDAVFVCADAGALPFASASFDALLALDVLEHLDDDSAAARELLRVLKPGGVAIITVPAFAALWSQHDEALDHRRRYRLQQISALLEEAGFELALQSYYNSWLFPIISAARIAERLLPRRPRKDTLRLPPRPINRALAAVLGSERWLLRHTTLPVGVSCLVVARRARSA